MNDDEGNPLRLDTDYTLAIAFRNDLGAFTPAQGVETQIQDVNDVLNLAITDDGKVSATPVSGNPPDAATYIYVVTATGMGDYEGTVTGEVTITVAKTSISTGTLTASAPPTLALSAKGEQLAADAISVNDDEGNPLRLDTDYTLAIAPRTEGPAFIAAQNVETNLTNPNDVLTPAITDDGKVSVTRVDGAYLVSGKYFYTVTATGMGDYEGTVTGEVTITVSQ